jgi:hypothetical protein
LIPPPTPDIGKIGDPLTNSRGSNSTKKTSPMPDIGKTGDLLTNSPGLELDQENLPNA